MFRRSLPTLKHLYEFSSSRTVTNPVTQVKPKWDLLCGVCLERKPKISRQPREIEVKFAQMLREIEEENSLKSDHELQLEAELKQVAESKKGNVTEEGLTDIKRRNAHDFEEKGRKELEAFSLASRITEADEKNDTKSTDRKLSEHLLYVTRVKLGNDEIWLLPYGSLNEKESLREAAERILREKFGRKVKANFYGNAPCGFYKYKYPKTLKEDVIGAKVFFMKAQYIAGDVEKNESTIDFSWNTMEELSDKMYGPYFKAVRLLILDDEK